MVEDNWALLSSRVLVEPNHQVEISLRPPFGLKACRALLSMKGLSNPIVGLRAQPALPSSQGQLEPSSRVEGEPSTHVEDSLCCSTCQALLICWEFIKTYLWIESSSSPVLMLSASGDLNEWVRDHQDITMWVKAHRGLSLGACSRGLLCSHRCPGIWSSSLFGSIFIQHNLPYNLPPILYWLYAFEEL